MNFKAAEVKMISHDFFLLLFWTIDVNRKCHFLKKVKLLFLKLAKLKRTTVKFYSVCIYYKA